MQFSKNELYHIYNRGDNQERIFFNEDNYLYFLKKVRRFVSPYCEILNYCLMPNHFHLFIYADERTVNMVTINQQGKNVLSEGIRNLLQTYTKGINKQKGRTGSLFQQNTKAKIVSDSEYQKICFTYIHQNPLKSKLVEKMEDWPYSSFVDFIGKRKGTLCNTKLAFKLLGLNLETFYADSYKMIRDEDAENIF